MIHGSSILDAGLFDRGLTLAPGGWFSRGGLKGTQAQYRAQKKRKQTQMLNVWYIYQHLGSLGGKCR